MEVLGEGAWGGGRGMGKWDRDEGETAVAEVVGLFAGFDEAGAVAGQGAEAVEDDGEVGGVRRGEEGGGVGEAEHLSIEEEALEALAFDERQLFGEGESLGERDLESDEDFRGGGGIGRLEVPPNFGRWFGANGLVALAAAELGQMGPEHFKVIADFGEGADGGAGGTDLVTLFEGDGGGDTGDGIDAGFIHAIEELTGVGGEGFDVAALAFGVEGIEGEGRFTGAAEAGDHDEVVGGEVEVEALEVVLAGAAEADRGRGWRQAHVAWGR